VLIGELVERTGVSARSLRYYEEQGLLAPERSGNGYRVFDDADVVVTQQIRGLIEAGFGTEIIAQLLPCARGTAPEIELCPSVVAAMTRVLAEIEERHRDLGRRRDTVRALLTADS
jgi:DNA-binding transcriptional MerR regulator